MDSDRFYAVISKLADYVKSPSLQHVRNPHSLQKLAREIVQSLDQASSVWRKWDGQRGAIAKAAACCWIPTDDLMAFLNRLPGPVLTRTDVAQRLRALWEEPWAEYPNEDLKTGCLALYGIEKAEGTELPAIIGALKLWINELVLVVFDGKTRSRPPRWGCFANDLHNRMRSQRYAYYAR